MGKLLKNSISHTICLISILTYTRCNDCEFHVEALLTRSQAYLGNHFWDTKTSDVTECAVMCIRRKRCLAFNYDIDNGRCELTDENGSPTQVPTNKVYSRISEWPSQVDQNCYDQPCEDDEVCIPGNLRDGRQCSNLCMKMTSKCPLLEGVKSIGPRTVGSTLNVTCDAGYRGGSSATCLPTLQWDKPIDTTCTPIYLSECKTNDECSAINGECVQSKCVCPDDFVYETSETKCLVDYEDWVRFETSCYMFDTVTMTFDQAEAFCYERNSHLVQVDSREEGEFIKQKLRNITANGGSLVSYWNDLFQFGYENLSERWKTTGDELKNEVADWGHYEPTSNAEKCTVFYFDHDFRWADVHCNRVHKPICEKQQSQ